MADSEKRVYPTRMRRAANESELHPKSGKYGDVEVTTDPETKNGIRPDEKTSVDLDDQNKLVETELGSGVINPTTNSDILILQKHFNDTLAKQNEFFKEEMNNLAILVRPLSKIAEEFKEFKTQVQNQLSNQAGRILLLKEDNKKTMK